MTTALKPAITMALALCLLLAMALPAAASTAVPGQQGRDGTVTGHYTMEDYLGTGCDYVVNYRGDFGGDPYLDDGWISNLITCDDGSAYSYTFVHETDPRYDGDPDRAIWGSWEWHSYTASGAGQLANPMHPEYAFGS